WLGDYRPPTRLTLDLARLRPLPAPRPAECTAHSRSINLKAKAALMAGNAREGESFVLNASSGTCRPFGSA
ncbi:MAG: hypothetical protein NZM11_12860, partial [Anaerolineales bacterium]|nr:hypothetical protein [Anaerolineales bacterium]